MQAKFQLNPVALAAAVSVSAALFAPMTVAAATTSGQYVAGDFHNHTTCSDGSISMQKLVKKSAEKGSDGTFGLDWFVQAGHGGTGNRNCTLVEDASLATPAYPYTAGMGPTTTWANSIGAANIKGLNGGVGGNGNMWRWQSIQEFQYPVMEYLATLKNQPLFIGMESVVAGHEHASMSVITGQMPTALDTANLPTGPGYVALGNANALAQWSYCFDRNDADTSRGNVTGSSTGNNWNCAVKGSKSTLDPSWNATAQKLMPVSGVGSGTAGHAKTVQALKWMVQNHATASYYVPAHLERAGPFNPDGNNGYNVEHLRNFNNAAPKIAFGFETQPGHHASSDRGEYRPKRNSFAGVMTDSVGGTTYGGTGVYGAQVGGVWDALLGEGRNWWFFASSDWHNRGIFGPDDRRSTQDFLPGEYQRDYVLVQNGSDKIRPQMVVNGLRTGNSFTASGQLIDRLAFVACVASNTMTEARVQALAVEAATQGVSAAKSGCATMGQKLVVTPGADIVVGMALRDPQGTNNSPYSFNNPSLLQVGVKQPLNAPVLDHVDLIRGLVSGYKTPGAADYSGEWPRNTAWLSTEGTTPADLSSVPDAAKNTSAAVLKTFNKASKTWHRVVSAVDGTTFLRVSYRIPAVNASQYLRLRGSNLPASVPYETDANGNPLADLFTNASDTSKLKITCTTVGTNVPSNSDSVTTGTINGCPNHLAVVNGQKMVSYDVAAWSDLWFYSNPVYVEVAGSTVVAGVK